MQAQKTTKIIEDMTEKTVIKPSWIFISLFFNYYWIIVIIYSNWYNLEMVLK